jgi:hypothetical protein
MAQEIGVDEFNVPEPDRIALAVENVRMYRDGTASPDFGTLYITKEYVSVAVVLFLS